MKKNIIIDIVFLAVLFLIFVNTIISYISYKNVIDEKDPMFFTSKTKFNNNITYNQILYKIVIENDNDLRIVNLKLFFIK